MGGMLNGQPSKQHTITGAYLGFFANKDGELVVYDRQLGQYRAQTPKTTTIERDFYTFHGDDYSIEKLMGSDIEGVVPGVLTKLNNSQALTRDDLEKFASWLGFLKYRTTYFRKDMDSVYAQWSKEDIRRRFSDVDRVRTMLEELQQRAGVVLDTTPEEMVEFAQSDRYIVSPPKEHSLALMLSMSTIAADFFLRDHSWVFLRAPNDTIFVTSDEPVVFHVSREIPPFFGVGLVTPGIEKIVPLTSHICLLMTDNPKVAKGEKVIDKGLVRKINRLVAGNSDRYVIGRDRAMVEWVVTKEGLQGLGAPRVQMG